MADATDDDWLTSMHDMQADLTKRAVNEVNVLRRRVRKLEAQISSGMASDLYAMRERVTQLETLLNEARADRDIQKALALIERLDGYLTSPEQVALADDLRAALDPRCLWLAAPNHTTNG